MYQQMKFLGKGFQKLDHKQDRQTDANRTHYDAAFADGKNIACIHAHLINTWLIIGWFGETDPSTWRRRHSITHAARCRSGDRSVYSNVTVIVVVVVLVCVLCNVSPMISHLVWSLEDLLSDPNSRRRAKNYRLLVSTLLLCLIYTITCVNIGKDRKHLLTEFL